MQQIFAFGGGAFGSQTPCFKLQAAMLEAANVPKPKILFLPTASGDPASYIEAFFQHASRHSCVPSVLPLFDSQSWSKTPREMIEEADVIWVGGGSTKNMLILWEAWGITPLLRAAYDRGCVCAGVSAGAICWFEQGNTDSLGPGLGVLDCLGWLPGSCTPHFSGEPLRKPVLKQQLLDGRIKDGVAIDDFCAAHYVDGQFSRVLAETDGGAYAVSRANAALDEWYVSLQRSVSSEQ